MKKEIKPAQPRKVRQITPAPGSALPAPAERPHKAGARQSLVDFMRQSPLSGLDGLELERDCSLSREARP